MGCALRLLAAGLCLLPATAHADDTQLWTTAVVQGPIDTGPGLKPMVWMEVQTRTANDVSHLQQIILRPGFGVRLGPDFNLLFGYQYQGNTPRGGRATNEHRLYQQLTLPLYRDPANLVILSRWRLEERSIENAQDLGWRLRAMVRLQAPLHGAGSPSVLAWSEAFIGLNDTDWGQRSGFGQLRVFGGSLVPLNNRLNLEAGYMAQIERMPGGTRVNHVANLALNYRIGQ